MEIKYLRLFGCVIVVTAFVYVQLIQTLVITRFGGYCIFRNKSGELEFVLFKPENQEIWTLPQAFVQNDSVQTNVSIKVLNDEFGLKLNDIQEVEDYVKTIVERVKKNYMNLTTFRVAELLNPDKPILTSPAFSECKWWPLSEIDERVDSRISNIFQQINVFLAPIVYD